jgi:glycosyltransferase involved in cell wall biosynthesis
VKVAFDVGPLKARPAGVGVYVRSLANALHARADVDLRLVGRRPDATGLPAASSHRSARVPYSIWNQVVAPLDVRRQHPDLVHFTDGLVPLVRMCPTVVTVLDLSLVRLWRTHRVVRYPRIPLILAAPRLADRIIVPSRATADDVMRLTGAAAGKIDIIPLAARSIQPANARRDTDILASVGLRPGRFILIPGTVEPRKNGLRVIEAFEHLAKRPDMSDTMLVLAGALGWGSHSIVARATDSVVNDRIRILGYVDDAVMSTLAGAAAFVAYVSLGEGFGLPVLEALTTGAIIVTSDRSSLPEVAGEAAILVDPSQVNAIAAGFAAAVDMSPDDRAKMSSAAIRRAAMFSWDLTAQLSVETYRRALSA